MCRSRRLGFVPMTRLTSVYGSFRARVMAARLSDEGFDVQLRGALDSPYGLTVGEMARVDLYVPDDQFDEASLVLLVAEVDEADDGRVPWELWEKAAEVGLTTYMLPERFGGGGVHDCLRPCAPGACPSSRWRR